LANLAPVVVTRLVQPPFWHSFALSEFPPAARAGDVARRDITTIVPTAVMRRILVVLRALVVSSIACIVHSFAMVWCVQDSRRNRRCDAEPGRKSGPASSDPLEVGGVSCHGGGRAVDLVRVASVIVELTVADRVLTTPSRSSSTRAQS
jgi:hypothetical protein